MRKQSNFLLLVTLAATATPAFGQTVESAGGAAATAASIPDFSGIWGRNWLFLEPPLSGPGPVVSKLRNPDGTMNILAGTVGDYTSPILTPQAAEIVQKNGEMELGGAVLLQARSAGRLDPNTGHPSTAARLAARGCR